MRDTDLLVRVGSAFCVKPGAIYLLGFPLIYLVVVSQIGLANLSLRADMVNSGSTGRFVFFCFVTVKRLEEGACGTQAVINCM